MGMALISPLTFIPTILAQETKKAEVISLTDGKASVKSSLKADDEKDKTQQQPCKVFTVDCKKGRNYKIDMASKEIDSYLRLEDASGKELAKDDDSGGLVDARISFSCRADGVYRVVCTTFAGGTGAFTLTVQESASAKTEELTLTNGTARVEAELTAADATDAARTRSVCRIYAIKLAKGKSYRIDMLSKDVDSYLRLEDSAGKELAKDDDGGGDRNARIQFDCFASGEFRIIATTYHGGVGGFILSVQEKNLELPTDWIDPVTGHRIIRLSPAGGGASLYFHQNAYTPEGDKLIFNAKGAIVAVDLTTLGVKSPKAEVVAQGNAIAMAFKTREVYFSKGGKGKGSIHAVHVDTKVVREVKNARGGTINADETYSVLAHAAMDPTGKTVKPEPRKLPPQRERMFGDKLKLGQALTPAEEASAAKEQRLAGRLANPASQAFTFTNLKTGEAKTVGYSYAWLNHLQFSPTDPNLLLFCHEGTWHEVDRVWTIRADGGDMKLIHKRTMDMEIAGHEFWSHDGKTIWFDLQTPRSKEFWLAGVDVETGAKVRYPIGRDQWSIHFNRSRDGKLFAGDGGDPGQVAFAEDGRWIHAFTPRNSELKKSNDGWSEGVFEVERLADMSKHNYKMEPNVTITPDGKWVVFRSNMHGPTHVYAVEVKKSK